MAHSSKSETRSIKSVSFADPDLLVFANKKADHLFGGNFSAYVVGLIQRDQEGAQARQSGPDLEARAFYLLQPYGAAMAKSPQSFDFEVGSLRLVVEVRAKFPRDKVLEYALIGLLHRAAKERPGFHVALVFPDDLLPQEKERFLQLQGAGIEGLKVCDFSEFAKFVKALAEEPSGQRPGAPKRRSGQKGGRDDQQGGPASELLNS